MEALRQEEAIEEQEALTVGRTVKKKFLAALLSGFLLLGGLAAVFGISGVAFAMPMGGIGTFMVQFDKLEGQGFKMLPHVGETGTKENAPLVRNIIDEATVYGLHIYKDIKIPVTDNWVRIHITADKPVHITGLIQDARFVSANLQFNDLKVAESNDGGWAEQWTQEGKSVTITDGEIVTTYLFQGTVTLNGTKINIEDIKDSVHE
ncbi:MAG TPA: DUF6230 family protein [Bacillales bacterium]|nr:DUF6230 family protein [Bacillales bacterium]